MNRGAGYGAPGATGSYSYGPVEASSFNVMLNISPNTGVFGYQIDGGPMQSIGSAATDATTVINVSAGTLGMHTITFTTSSSGFQGPAIVVGVEPVVSTGSLMITRGGIYGMTSGQLSQSTTVFGGFNVAETVVDPAISVFIFGSNDWSLGVPVSTYIANMTDMVTAARSVGSVPMLMVPPEPEYSTSQVSGVTGIPFIDYESALVTLGSQLDVPVLNLSQTLGNWNSKFMGDEVHPNNVGYEDIAVAVYCAFNGLIQDQSAS
jgi:hypothetical protein